MLKYFKENSSLKHFAYYDISAFKRLIMLNNNNKKLLKTKDAAAFLGVSPAWLKRNRLGLTNAPKIPCLVINAKNVKYLLADLESYSNKLETIYKQGGVNE